MEPLFGSVKRFAFFLLTTPCFLLVRIGDMLDRFLKNPRTFMFPQEAFTHHKYLFDFFFFTFSLKPKRKKKT